MSGRNSTEDDELAMRSARARLTGVINGDRDATDAERMLASAAVLVVNGISNANKQLSLIRGELGHIDVKLTLLYALAESKSP